MPRPSGLPLCAALASFVSRCSVVSKTESPKGQGKEQEEQSLCSILSARKIFLLPMFSIVFQLFEWLFSKHSRCSKAEQADADDLSISLDALHGVLRSLKTASWLPKAQRHCCANVQLPRWMAQPVEEEVNSKSWLAGWCDLMTLLGCKAPQPHFSPLVCSGAWRDCLCHVKNPFSNFQTRELWRKNHVRCLSKFIEKFQFSFVGNTTENL